MRCALLCVFILCAVQSTLRAQWKAGAARERITPTSPVWMTGYGSRTHPSTGVAADIYTRALALDDGSGKPAVLLTTDCLGMPAKVAAEIAREVEKQYGIPRDRLILSFTHTHGGPALTHPHQMLYIRATPEEVAAVDRYTRDMQQKTVDAVGGALKQMRPARVRFGHSSAPFAMNRRKPMPTGYVISPNEGGPVDHDVPLLLVESNDGQRIAVVFGYACHNTTMGGDTYDIHGDYAGFAQAELEKESPVAMFVTGCGGDANPNPRGTLDLARQHGKTLASAVQKGLGGDMKELTVPLKSDFRVFPVDFAKPPTREELEKQLQNKDEYFRWHAKELLKVMDKEGKLPAAYPYPLGVWQFGDDLTLIAMSGEVVVDYDLRLKKELGAQNTWVAGYCNDLFAYIPSRRVLEEGGYEAGGAMTYYVQPGPFAPTVEETIVKQAHEMVAGVKGR